MTPKLSYMTSKEQKNYSRNLKTGYVRRNGIMRSAIKSS